jgi:hypothetical protein
MRKDAVLLQLEQEWKAAVAAQPEEELTHPGWLREMPAPFPWRPTALFAEVEDVRRDWQDLREWKALRKYAERYVNPGWRYKDLLAHLASWAEEFRRELETVAAGGSFDYEIRFMPVVGPTEWNEREVAKRRELTLDEIFGQYEAALARVQDLLLTIPRERLLGQAPLPLMYGGEPMQGGVPRIVMMCCFHNRYHFAQIRTRLAQLERTEKR